MNGWVGGNQLSFDTAIRYLDRDINQGAMVEGVVADHLIRTAFNLSPRKRNFEYSDLLYYWRYGKDREVDFVYSDGTSVKFRSR